MINKTYTFGLLATLLIIAPSAAFAGDSQGNSQNVIQNATAVGRGNTVVNNANQQSIQNSTRVGNGNLCSGPLAQVSNQTIAQNGVAVGEFNTVVNNASQLNIQNLIKAANGGCN